MIRLTNLCASTERNENVSIDEESDKLYYTECLQQKPFKRILSASSKDETFNKYRFAEYEK
jgi:hypothetical protein